MNTILPCLWFNSEAEEASRFYTSLFYGSQILDISKYTASSAKLAGKQVGDVMNVSFALAGEKFWALNGGEGFKINPSISILVTCEDLAEVDKLWSAFSQGGKIIKYLEKYPWCEKYGWVQDRFGLSWQIYLGSGDIDQKFTPYLMFGGDRAGQAEEAMKYYCSIFKPSEQVEKMYYEKEDNDKREFIKYAMFRLLDKSIAVMDSSHFDKERFSEGTSLVVECSSQAQIDYYWDKLSKDGDPSAQGCGWLKDKFGVSWQVVPSELEEMTADYTSPHTQKVVDVMLGMKKLDIDVLRGAYRE